MPWDVQFHPELATEFDAFAEAVQDALLAHATVLASAGPIRGRPLADTLKGSSISNLKELRFDAVGGVWRVAFAFDGRRIAVLLAAGDGRRATGDGRRATGDGRGRAQQRFYKALIATAERRWSTWTRS